MKDRISNPGKANITPIWLEYINLMVEEIVLQGASFDKNKKWLKKHCELYNVDYDAVEKDLVELFEMLPDYNRATSESIRRVIKAKAMQCYITDDTFNKLVSANKPVQQAGREKLEFAHHKKKPENPKMVNEEAGSQVEEDRLRMKRAEDERKKAENLKKVNEEARRQAEEDRLLMENAEKQRKQAEILKKANEDARRKAENERINREIADKERKKAENLKKVNEEARRQAEEDRLLIETAEKQRKQAENLKKANEDARRKAENERINREIAEKERKKAENLKKVNEDARRQAEEDRQSLGRAEKENNRLKPGTKGEKKGETETGQFIRGITIGWMILLCLNLVFAFGLLYHEGLDIAIGTNLFVHFLGFVTVGVVGKAILKTDERMLIFMGTCVLAESFLLVYLNFF
jgi:hypothetical protein